MRINSPVWRGSLEFLDRCLHLNFGDEDSVLDNTDVCRPLILEQLHHPERIDSWSQTVIHHTHWGLPRLSPSFSDFYSFYVPLFIAMCILEGTEHEGVSNCLLDCLISVSKTIWRAGYNKQKMLLISQVGPKADEFILSPVHAWTIPDASPFTVSSTTPWSAINERIHVWWNKDFFLFVHFSIIWLK